MYTDPISDMLTRIRNASLVRKAEVVIPFSKLKFEIAKLLKHENYVDDFSRDEENGLPVISIKLKYQDKQPVIRSIKRVSKPGRRVYVKKEDVPVVLNGLGVAIISTPKGLLTNRQARREGLGGEVICELW